MFGKFVTANERREEGGGEESEDWLNYDYRTVAFLSLSRRMEIIIMEAGNLLTGLKKFGKILFEDLYASECNKSNF